MTPEAIIMICTCDLAGQVRSRKLAAETGISHTRWATHGAPVTRNAHPMVSRGEIALVHNGIIENYEELRAELKAKGYEFDSQTDTEVITHLVHSCYRGDLFQAVRRAVRAWGLEILCKDPKYYSSTLTAVLMPDGHNADALRNVALESFDVSLGTGLSKVAGKVFRIGHLGDTNDLTIIATLAGVEMSLSLAGVPYKPAGVVAAMGYFTETAKR